MAQESKRGKLARVPKVSVKVMGDAATRAAFQVSSWVRPGRTSKLEETIFVQAGDVIIEIGTKGKGPIKVKPPPPPPPFRNWIKITVQ